MNHLTNDDKEKLLSQMRNMDYVKSYDMMQRKGTMYQVKNRQPRKILKIRKCYCEKNFRDGFYELVSRYISNKNLGSVNVTPCAAQPCCNTGNFFAGKQPEIFREIDEIVTKHKSINNIKELIEDESINEIYLKLSDEWKRLCVRCNAECKLGMIATSGINDIVYMFEDNFVVYNNTSNTYIASDSRSLRYIFSRYLDTMGLNVGDSIDESDVISDILKSLEGSRNDFFNKLSEYNYVDAISFAKNYIINRLEQFHCDKHTDENLQNLNNEVFINENRKMRRGCINDFRAWGASAECAVLLKTLFLLTDGCKEKFDDLAKIIAEIVIGPRLSKAFEINIPQASLIKTNNTTFTRDFLLNIFWALVPNSRACGVTQYSAAELSNKNMTGKFIEDKLYSRYLNITNKLNFNNSAEYEKYLFDLINGKVVKGKNEYLGEQKISSSMYYVFLASGEDDISKFTSNHCNIIELGNSLPKNIEYLAKCTGEKEKHCRTLNIYEVKFVLVHVANYGLELLLKEQQENTKKKSYREVIKAPVGFFIEKCCTVIDNIEEGTKPNASNATGMPTFTAAYNLFYKIANDIYGNRKFDKNIGTEEGFVGKIIKDRSNDVRERDLKNGYGEGEVLKKDSKSNHCLGIIVKPKEEIKNIALEYKESLQHNMQKWSDEEFVDFMIQLNQSYKWMW
ncbi:hypothetical protein [Phascolarctobacterium succinatutens]|uniref:hypothetical protein n=1 Tax=Phascolarctobacterium succinatutens TaxID=626940 RepID=UPI00266F3D2E|nr:hypothetical protein [Phascolarctobacterium succinatutens]